MWPSTAVISTDRTCSSGIFENASMFPEMFLLLFRITFSKRMHVFRTFTEPANLLLPSKFRRFSPFKSPNARRSPFKPVRPSASVLRLLALQMCSRRPRIMGPDKLRTQSAGVQSAANSLTLSGAASGISPRSRMAAWPLVLMVIPCHFSGVGFLRQSLCCLVNRGGSRTSTACVLEWWSSSSRDAAGGTDEGDDAAMVTRYSFPKTKDFLVPLCCFSYIIIVMPLELSFLKSQNTNETNRCRDPNHHPEAPQNVRLSDGPAVFCWRFRSLACNNENSSFAPNNCSRRLMPSSSPVSPADLYFQK